MLLLLFILCYYIYSVSNSNVFIVIVAVIIVAVIVAVIIADVITVAVIVHTCVIISTVYQINMEIWIEHKVFL